MQAIFIILGALAVAVGGYRWYAGFIDRKVIQADPQRVTPAKMYMDGVDFMPTSKYVLFGYQFKSIAGAGPVVGGIAGILVGLPAVQAPAYTQFTIGIGPLWPILFVTIACGAISGWHSMVTTSGTCRQLEYETDAKPVLAGSMFVEMLLGVVALMTAAAAMPFSQYKEIMTKGGGAGPVFATGLSNFLNIIGLPLAYGKTTDGWVQEIYRTSRLKPFFGEPPIRRRVMQSEWLARLYADQMSKLFGFVSEPLIMTNTRNAPLYALFLASHKAAAVKIMNEIFNRRLRRLRELGK